MFITTSGFPHGMRESFVGWDMGIIALPWLSTTTTTFGTFAPWTTWKQIKKQWNVIIVIPHSTAFFLTWIVGSIQLMRVCRASFNQVSLNQTKHKYHSKSHQKDLLRYHFGRRLSMCSPCKGCKMKAELVLLCRTSWKPLRFSLGLRHYIRLLILSEIRFCLV